LKNPFKRAKKWEITVDTRFGPKTVDVDELVESQSSEEMVAWFRSTLEKTIERDLVRLWHEKISGIDVDNWEVLSNGVVEPIGTVLNALCGDEEFVGKYFDPEISEFFDAVFSLYFKANEDNLGEYLSRCRLTGKAVEEKVEAFLLMKRSARS
jgi:hypothetical protein